MVRFVPGKSGNPVETECINQVFVNVQARKARRKGQNKMTIRAEATGDAGDGVVKNLYKIINTK